MSVVYRAVKANENDDVIAIGYDENQGGVDYHGIGAWCDFTFDEIPQASAEIMELVDNKPINILKAVDDTIVVKSKEEIEAEIEKLLEEEPVIEPEQPTEDEEVIDETESDSASEPTENTEENSSEDIVEDPVEETVEESTTEEETIESEDNDINDDVNEPA